MESDISSLSSGWGDGPVLPTPVLVNDKPMSSHKISIPTIRKIESGKIVVVPGEVV